MNYIFKTDLDKRKVYLKAIAKSKRSWPFRMACFWLLMFLTLAIVVGIGYIVFTSGADLDAVIIGGFSAMTFCLACVPFIIGIAVKRSAKYACASPYSGMTNGMLILTDSYLEFVFWKASKEAPAAYSSKRASYQDEDKFIYRFDKDKIKSIKIDEFHVCHVGGNGTLTVPDWASSNDNIETKSAKSFSFVTCFTDENCESIILKWRDA